jgi:hypothetical protein
MISKIPPIRTTEEKAIKNIFRSVKEEFLDKSKEKIKQKGVYIEK